MSTQINAIGRTGGTIRHPGTRLNEAADRIRATQSEKELQHTLLDWRGQLVGWGA